MDAEPTCIRHSRKLNGPDVPTCTHLSCADSRMPTNACATTALRIEIISTGMLKTLWKRRLKVAEMLRIRGVFTSLHQTVAFPKRHEQAQTFLPFDRKI